MKKDNPLKGIKGGRNKVSPEVRQAEELMHKKALQDRPRYWDAINKEKKKYKSESRKGDPKSKETKKHLKRVKAYYKNFKRRLPPEFKVLKSTKGLSRLRFLGPIGTAITVGVAGKEAYRYYKAHKQYKKNEEIRKERDKRKIRDFEKATKKRYSERQRKPDRMKNLKK